MSSIIAKLLLCVKNIKQIGELFGACRASPRRMQTPPPTWCPLTRIVHLTTAHPTRLVHPVPHIPFVVPRAPLSVHILLGAVYHPTPAQACMGQPCRASWNTCPHACRRPLQPHGSAGASTGGLSERLHFVRPQPAPPAYLNGLALRGKNSCCFYEQVILQFLFIIL